VKAPRARATCWKVGRKGNAAGQAHANAHAGKKWRISRSRPRRIPTAPTAAVTLPRAQHGGAQTLFWLVIEADEAHHQQVTPGVVVAVGERQLLRAVRGIVGGTSRLCWWDLDSDSAKSAIRGS
jgi:hypothetical protein